MPKSTQVNVPETIREAKVLLRQGSSVNARNALCLVMSSDRAQQVVTCWVLDIQDARERREQRDRTFKLRNAGVRI